MVRMTHSIRFSQTQVLPISNNSGNVLCPPLDNLVGDGASVSGANAPNSCGVSLEHLVSELASQITRQGEQFTLFTNDMADLQQHVRDLTDASTRARLSGPVLTTNVPMVIDKSLESLRAQLDALQSASVSSVEMKSVVSDTPLPMPGGSAASSPHRDPLRASLLGEDEGARQPRGRSIKLLSHQFSRRQMLGTSRMMIFHEVQFWSGSLVVCANVCGP